MTNEELLDDLEDFVRYMTEGRSGYHEQHQTARAAVLARMAGPGEVVVPVEPTEAMCRAGRRMLGEQAISMGGYTGYINHIDTGHWPEAQQYRAMLAARPNRGGKDDAAA